MIFFFHYQTICFSCLTVVTNLPDSHTFPPHYQPAFSLLRINHFLLMPCHNRPPLSLHYNDRFFSTSSTFSLPCHLYDCLQCIIPLLLFILFQYFLPNCDPHHNHPPFIPQRSIRVFLINTAFLIITHIVRISVSSSLSWSPIIPPCKL